VRQIEIGPRFEDWQSAARALLRAGVPPDQIAWREVEHPSLFDRSGTEAPAGDASPVVRVPRAFLDLARRVAAGRDPDRWRLLYEALWRIANESRDVLANDADPLVKRLHALAHEPPPQRAPTMPPTRADDGDAPEPGAASFVPAGASLPELRAAAARCEGCDLYRHASQTVFGRGPADARIVLVGEQPGDQDTPVSRRHACSPLRCRTVRPRREHTRSVSGLRKAIRRVSSDDRTPGIGNFRATTRAR
jgi:hypothetical protein